VLLLQKNQEKLSTVLVSKISTHVSKHVRFSKPACDRNMLPKERSFWRDNRQNNQLLSAPEIRQCGVKKLYAVAFVQICASWEKCAKHKKFFLTKHHESYVLFLKLITVASK
jgi:hypothetical protein